MPRLTSLSVGDWVQVKIRWRRGKPGVSVMSGVIVEEDPRTMGFQQFKLDNNCWFGTQDEIMQHKPKSEQ